MKKLDGMGMGKQKLAKRRVNKDLVKLQSYQSEIVPTKDWFQVFQDKIILDNSSTYFSFEVVYFLAVQRKNKLGSQQQARNKSKTFNNDRYMTILHKKVDSKSQFYLLLSHFKEGDIVLKNSFDLQLLKGVDFGSDENELLLSFENADHNVAFNGQKERDESVSIIVQICKQVIGIEISLGYSIDIDALNYVTTVNGTLTMFPFLQKLIQLTGSQTNDLFTEEEKEAEILLEELNWSSKGGSHMELQQILRYQADALNIEIIDFLLQWEEQDTVGPTTSESSSSTSKSTASKSTRPPLQAPVAVGKFLGMIGTGVSTALGGDAVGFSSWTGAAGGYNNDNDRTTTTVGGGLSAAAGTTTTTAGLGAATMSRGMRDTAEVLTSLTLVDHELHAVDNWLEEQIGTLAEIQANLHMIEEESSQLETSWNNLNSVKATIELLVKGYSITERAATLLVDPARVINPVIKSPSLDDLQFSLSPLIEAVQSLRNALNLRITNIDSSFASGAAVSGGGNDNLSSNGAVTALQWKQLQAMTALSTQKAKLTQLADQFCSRFGEIALSLFEWIAKHKFVSEGGSQGHGLLDKQFSLTTLLNGFVYHKIVYDAIGGISEVSVNAFKLLKSQQSNPFYSAHKLFHACVRPFFPLLDLFIDLSPNSSRLLREAYLRAGTERVINPLLKALCKDTAAMLTLASISWSANGANPTATVNSSTAAGAAGNIGNLFSKAAGTLQIGTTTRPTYLSLANCQPYLISITIPKAPVKFHTTSTMTPWMALKLVLGVLAPIVEQEEAFLKESFHLDSGSSTAAAAMAFSGGTTDGAVDAFNNSVLGQMMESLCEWIVYRIESTVCSGLCLTAQPVAVGGQGRSGSVTSAGSTFATTTVTHSVSSGGAVGTGGHVDGMESIALLAVLAMFSSAYMEIIYTQLAADAELLAEANRGNVQYNSAQQQQPGGAAVSIPIGGSRGSITGGGGGGPPSGRIPRVRRASSMMGAAAFNAAAASGSSGGGGGGGGSSGKMGMGALGANVNVPTPSTFQLTKICRSLESVFTHRVQMFTSSEISWITAQKGDPKQAEILAPFSNFPRLIIQALELKNGLEFPCVDDLFCKISRELFGWLALTAAQSDKYANKMKVANFTYYSMAVGSLNIPILSSFVSNATQQAGEAITKYVKEMVARQFPALASLADRIDEVGARFSEEELSLFIRRKDVLNVLKELETKSLDSNIAELSGRIKKHFLSEFDESLKLASKMWKQIKERVHRILVRLEEAASASYQIVLDNGPAAVAALFDKHGSAIL